MSIEVMSAVWDRSTAYGGELLILLAIANYADINGRAYPSIRTLAQRGRMTERNAQYCIQKLEALGELKVERNAGPHGTHVFHVLLKGENFSGCKVFTHQKKRKRNKDLTRDYEKIAGENVSGVQTFQGETHFTGGVKPISPEPSVEPSVKEETKPPENANAFSSPQSPSGDGDVRPNVAKGSRKPKKPKELPAHDPEGYQQFIDAYPRRIALDEAVKAWDAIKPDTALKAHILDDIQTRRHSHQKWAEGFITNPATYLRGRRWTDELVPLTQARASPKSQAYKQGPTHAGIQQWLDDEQRKETPSP